MQRETLHSIDFVEHRRKEADIARVRDIFEQSADVIEEAAHEYGSVVRHSCGLLSCKGLPCRASTLLSYTMTIG